MTTEAEQQLAYHGPVRLHGWSESSTHEFKFKLQLLDGREALSHFEKATKRRGKKAGQRYKAFWQDSNGQSLNGPDELWFAGANWSHQGDAIVVFTPHRDDVEWIRSQNTADADEELTPKMYLGLVQVDDDEKPLNQTQAALVEWAETLVGGPHSKAAAMRCAEPEFQVFVALRLGLKKAANADQCDQYIKRQCGIHTKKLLDHVHPHTGEAFWERYQRRVQTPYITWLESRGARTRPAEPIETPGR